MKRSSLALAVVAVAALSAGCGGKYGPNCKKEVELTPPWSSLDLPVSAGRVCESSGKEAKLQYISKDDSKWRDAYKEAFVQAGYEEKDCKKGYCIYEKGKSSRVQVIVSSVSRWVNVSLHENR